MRFVLKNGPEQRQNELLFLLVNVVRLVVLEKLLQWFMGFGRASICRRNFILLQIVELVVVSLVIQFRVGRISLNIVFFIVVPGLCTESFPIRTVVFTGPPPFNQEVLWQWSNNLCQQQQMMVVNIIVSPIVRKHLEQR